jgi:2-polyprenyl-3-methyl-5-hydroxy-6-metoxy-1,4-benzoquinol methylase
MENIGEGKAFDRRVGYLAYNFAPYMKTLTSMSEVLEIGPGIGEMIHLLNERGVTKIDIIDNDRSVLTYNEKNHSVRRTTLSHDNDMSKYVKGSYDLIVLTQVFEHIPKSEYIPWVTTLYKALRSGGSIVITVPNGANPLVGTERYGDLQHENVFTVYSFRELMTFAHLKSSSYVIRGFEIPPNSPVNIVRIILQKILHGIFILMMMVNGAIYQTLMTPNISLVITKKA